MDQEVDTGYFVLPCEFIEAGAKSKKVKKGAKKPPNKTGAKKKTGKYDSESFCFGCQSITGDVDSVMNDKLSVKKSTCTICRKPKTQYINMGGK